MLGMRYRGNFVVGLTDKSPRQPRDRAASCPVNYRTPCNAATAAMPDRPNPHVLTGALVSSAHCPCRPQRPTPLIGLVISRGCPSPCNGKAVLLEWLHGGVHRRATAHCM